MSFSHDVTSTSVASCSAIKCSNRHPSTYCNLSSGSPLKTKDYEPLDMLHAFLQVKLKSAVCGDDCSREFPVPVLFCQNCSVIPIFCGASSICGGLARSAPDLPANSRNPDVGEKERPGPFLGLRARRQAEVPIPPEPLVAQKWRVAEMIMFPMIAILLIGLVAVLVIILLWMKQARENSARCNVGFRYLKDEQTVVPTY